MLANFITYEVGSLLLLASDIQEEGVGLTRRWAVRAGVIAVHESAAGGGKESALGIDLFREILRADQGMVTAEAMSHGVVPIAANTGGQKEIINDGGSGFLVDTIDELIEKTKFLTDNEDEWKNFSKRAKERSKVFGLDRFYRQWQEVCLKFRS